MNIIEKSAVELVNALKEGRISAKELLEITVRHSEQVAETCNPFAITLYDRASKAAAAADKLLAEGLGGPLCGLPVTIKDSQWLAGVPCANGSRTLADFIPEETCAAVKRLEEAGAVIFAKTTCPEFSLTGTTNSEFYGLTSNPWNTEYTCGGSSGGAGAAVAAGAGSLALGGDGGGSIRIPAAFCGIVGFKPSFKAVPREPGFPAWSTLVAYGPMARSVADARLMYSVLVANNEQHDHLDYLTTTGSWPSSLPGQKIIVSEDLGFAPVDEDVRQAFRKVVAMLEGAGAEIIYDQPNLPSSVITWVTTAHYDSWSFQKQKSTPLQGIDDSTREMMEFAASLEIEEYNLAEWHRKTVYDAYMAMFERAGTAFFITPTLGLEAFKNNLRHPETIGDAPIDYPWLDWASFLYDANLTGMPACALPMGLGDKGLPISIQLSGPVGTDAAILNLAEALESLIGWDNSPVMSGRESAKAC
ncbi:amidase [Psychromonas sp.]|uniref:amidase n=1 Tax=Psychromonas sp. TaxID=1884585 RepID=UPI003568B035